MTERVRAQNVGNAVVALAQGVNFFHAGQDLLRSSSLDRDSFNSGDWFNRLDFTYESNNFGVGLPVAEKNQSNWPIQGPLLANPDLVPASSDIVRNVDVTREWLEVRESSPLFHLETAAEVQEPVSFLNTGASQIPGLIAMQIADPAGGTTDLDLVRDGVVALFNPTDEPIEFAAPQLAGKGLELHPVLAGSVDPLARTSTFDDATGTFVIPARAAEVFVDPGPDLDPPTAIAAFDTINAGRRTGRFRVEATCVDDRPGVVTLASLNGVMVDDGDIVRLVTTRHRRTHRETPWGHVVRAPTFELTVRCTDAAGNVSTADARPQFREPGHPRPR